MQRLRPLLLILALSAALAACSGNSRPAPLSDEELGLVRDLLQLTSARILAGHEPERAATVLDSVLARTGEDELRGRLEALWRDPQRGQRVFHAVHESLETLQGELVSPPTSRGGG